MNQDELRQELNELHLQLSRELDDNGKLDETTAASLKQIAADIERLLQRQIDSADPVAADELDTSSLESLAVGFEVEHPQLASLINRVNYLLGNMGI